MKADIAKKWVEALRSGEYQQGHSHLCKDNRHQKSFCCLGVLCDIVKDEIGGRWIKDGSELVFSTGVVRGMSALYLPAVVCDFVGMQSPAGRYTTDGTAEFLAYQNDRGLSFEQIADIIEAHAEDL